MVTKQAMAPFCAGLHHDDLRLHPGDVRAALEQYQTAGRKGTLVVLNPKNEKLAGEVPEGVAVEFSGGCGRWEVFLAGEKPGIAPQTTLEAPTTNEETALPPAPMIFHPPTILSTVNQQKTEVDKIKSRPPSRFTETRGRKRIGLPEDLVIQWSRDGEGAKSIATRLRADGQAVSYKTVQRLISRQLPLMEAHGDN